MPRVLPAGVHTIEAIAFASKRELCEIKGMSDAKVAKIKEAGELMLLQLPAPRRRLAGAAPAWLPALALPYVLTVT